MQPTPATVSLSADKTECTGTLPVTREVSSYLKEQGFNGFSPNTHLVAMPHFLPDVIDWLTALMAMGLKPENIHLLGKQYSQVDKTRDKLKAMGIDVIDYTPAPIGGYYETLQEKDLPKFWERSLKSIEHSLATEGPQNVLVMGDGGRVLRSVPQTLVNNPNVNIVGVEQTTNGFDVVRKEGHQIDIVIPAMSALKLEFEPPFIADAAIRKLREKLGMFRNRDVAVVGVGKIGGSVAMSLAENNNNVFVYDRDVKVVDGKLHDPKNIIPLNVNVYAAPRSDKTRDDGKLELRASVPPNDHSYYICDSLEQAVQSSNYVFGCTGKDIFADIDLDKMVFHGANKRVDETRFISVSSGDKEFLSLLKWIAKQPAYLHHGPDPKGGSRWDVTLNHKGSRLRVMQQGFPINFDGQSGSGTPEEMQLISSFLLASIVQAYEYSHKYQGQSTDNKKNLIMLSPEVQRQILLTWLQNVPGVQDLYKPERIEEIRNSPDWFAQYSLGTFAPVFESDFPIPECLADKITPVIADKVRQANVKH